MQDGTLYKILNEHTDTVRAITFIQQDKQFYLASGSQDGTIKLWDYQSSAFIKSSIQSFEVASPYERMTISNARGLDISLRQDLIALGAEASDEE